MNYNAVSAQCDFKLTRYLEFWLRKNHMVLIQMSHFIIREEGTCFLLGLQDKTLNPHKP